MDRTYLNKGRDGALSLDRTSLRSLPLPTAHVVAQALAWTWGLLVSMAVGSFLAFGNTVLAQALVPAGVFVILAVFRLARDQAQDA